MNVTEQDSQWMQLALKLAEQGIGLTAPNPPVGAVLALGDRLLGKGYHRRAGLLHAEREAFKDALENGNGNHLSEATLYVTLEPCSTHGKTPPCTDAILEHRVARVVYGSTDPNPKHAGAAFQLLKNAGVVVESGCLEDECDDLIRAFRKNILHQRPWVIVKTAMSLDGRIVRKPGNPQWLTSPQSRRRVHTWRAQSDAILTGGQTVRADNPALTIREADRVISPDKIQPWRIIATRSAASIPASSVCLTDEWKERTLIYEDIRSWKSFLEVLYSEKQISTLMVEAGGDLVRRLLEESLVDEWVGFYAPMIVGGETLAVEGGNFFPHEARLNRVLVDRFGDDICINGLLSYEH